MILEHSICKQCSAEHRAPMQLAVQLLNHGSPCPGILMLASHITANAAQGANQNHPGADGPTAHTACNSISDAYLTTYHILSPLNNLKSANQLTTQRHPSPLNLTYISEV